MSDPRRRLPRVDEVLARLGDLPRPLARAAVRAALDARREAGAPAAAHVVADEARAAVCRWLDGRIRPVLNATGVVLHTNLGRAPWSPRAIARAMAVAGGYANLELELETGERGGRMRGVSQGFRALTGAEDALVVNNGAAALLLALTALAAGREVIVSRGELVEIGGGFRVPEVVAAGGARLVEVGTTNRTRVGDYAAAITDRTAVILKVHPSNFRFSGFWERPEREELSALARSRGLCFVEDVGSGAVRPMGDEPVLADAVAVADLVTCSGDKLFGGPQAGIVLGRAARVAEVAQHPLLRALRVDKVTLAAVEATVADWLAGATVPAIAMLEADGAALRARCSALVAAIGVGVLETGAGLPGGGALPGIDLPGPVVRLVHPDAESLAAALRRAEPPVVARVHRGAVLLDLRTIPAEDDPRLAAAVRAALDRAPLSSGGID